MEEMIMDSILCVKNLSIQIHNRTLVGNASFHLDPGEAVLLSGPNGCGKSTLLKSILRLEPDGKIIDGQIIERSFGNILELKREELQAYRSRVAYVPQKDDYSEMGSVQVRDIISECCQAHTGRAMSYGEVNDLIEQWIPPAEGSRPVFDAKAKPAKFSGGEQRLLSVLSVIGTRPHTELMIIDEPLNNLDFINARNISNLLNKVIQENRNMALLMISHCRIFPFITREIALTPTGLRELQEPYLCHSCFGEPDHKGFYR